MFEAVELGRKVSKRDFEDHSKLLHTRLLKIQRQLRNSETSVIVIVSGVEGAGKGGLVNRLNKWLDTRGVQTNAFWDESEEERNHPHYWRFWRKLPPRGSIGVMFGSWYTPPIVDTAFGRMDQASFEKSLKRIREFEHMLTEDGALIVKFWFHVRKETQRKRLKKKDKRHLVSSPHLKAFAKKYDELKLVSEEAIRLTDTGAAPWHLIESENCNYRDLSTGEILCQEIENRLAQGSPNLAVPHRTVPRPIPGELANRTILDQVDLSQVMEPDVYRKTLKDHQTKLHDLAWKAHKRGISTVMVFEGWDAAGKGGAIRRLTAAIDARLYRVIPIAAPTDEERAQHYLWRFWRQTPSGGAFAIFDRSWYGRVLVERVEGFAQPAEWMRAYQEINAFEEQLHQYGIVVIKFWLHLSQEEQLRRFQEREKTPWKHHKLTEEDWRNREKWGEYEAAVNDMIARTSTQYAPWTLVAADDKRYARIQVVKTVCQALKAKMDPKGAI